MVIHCAYDKIVPIDELIPHPKNRNDHPSDQIDRLIKIIEYQGIRAPIRVSKRSGMVTSGHGRLLAAQKAGWPDFPVSYQDYDTEEQEYADIQSDNAIASWAILDLSTINYDIGDLGPDFDIDLLGIKDFVVEPLDKLEPQSDEDDVPEKVPARTRLGDVYQLGSHRLMCGDSTSIDAVKELMNGQKADITFTSPPYNVGKTPNGNDQKYLNDSDSRDSSEYCDLLVSFTNTAILVSQYVFCNIQSLAGNKTALIDYLFKLKDYYAETIIWDKVTAEPAMAKNVLNSRFEYIHIFSNKANRAIGTKEFRGTLENVFQHNSRKDKEFSSIHKATYPVSFVEYFVSNFSTVSVFDPFGGSGSTLIACERSNRHCFMMELDPHYCDVIVTRWENYTGKKAELLNGGG